MAVGYKFPEQLEGGISYNSSVGLVKSESLQISIDDFALSSGGFSYQSFETFSKEATDTILASFGDEDAEAFFAKFPARFASLSRFAEYVRSLGIARGERWVSRNG